MSERSSVPAPEARLADWAQMCDAPSRAYSAGAWCEAANELLALVTMLAHRFDWVHPADLAAALATVEQTREALREEVKKRHHYKDGSQPDTEWLDAYIAKTYPALAAVPDPEAPDYWQREYAVDEPAVELPAVPDPEEDAT